MDTFLTEIVKGVLPSRHAASDVQTGVPYFIRLAASNSLGFGEYGENLAMAKAAKVPDAPGNLSAGVALHVDEVSTPSRARKRSIGRASDQRNQHFPVTCLEPFLSPRTSEHSRPPIPHTLRKTPDLASCRTWVSV